MRSLIKNLKSNKILLMSLITILQFQDTSPSTFSDISNVLNEIGRSGAGLSSKFLLIAKSIGYSAVLIIWGMDIARAMSSGSPIDFTKYFYPMVLAGLLGSYGTISAFLMKVGTDNKQENINIGQRYTLLMLDDEQRYAAMAGLELTEGMKNLGDNYLHKILSGTAANDPNVLRAVELMKASEEAGGAYGTVKSIFSKMSPAHWIGYFLKLLSCTIGAAGYYILLVIVRFRLAILAIIGPIAIGISIIPAFQSSAANFVHKAISYILWIPLASIVNSGIGAAMNAVALNSLTGPTTILALVIFQIILYFQIPKVANEVIMVGGGRQGSGIGQAIMNKAVSAASGGGSGAAAAASSAKK